MIPTQKNLLLLIEDESSIAKPLTKILQLKGFQTQWVQNGLDGLAWLRVNERPACILLDIMMPKMNGWQFLEALKMESPHLMAIPLIVLSADNQSGRQAGAGHIHFLSKPINLSNLFSILQKFIESQGSKP